MHLELPHTVTASLFWEQTIYKALMFSVIAVMFFWRVRKFIDRREEKRAMKKDYTEGPMHPPESVHPMDYSRRKPKKQDWKSRTNRLGFLE